MNLFNSKEIGELLKSSQIGLWKIEFEDPDKPCFYADDMLDELLGIDFVITPEERFKFHRSHIHKDDVELFEEYANKLFKDQAEITYRYIHPKLGEMYVRCGGMRDSSVKEHLCIRGTHQNISETIRFEQDKVAEKRLAEKNIELKNEYAFTYNLYKRLMQVQTCGIVAYKLPSREIIVMNDMAKKLYGYSLEDNITMEMINQKSKEIFFENEQDTLKDFDKLKNKDGQISFTMKIMHKDKSFVNVWTTSKRVELENGEIVIISSLQDISTLTQVQKMNKDLEEQLDIIQTLGKIYNSLYYIDMEDGTFIELGSKIEGVRNIIGASGNAKEKFEAMCQHIVTPEYAEIMRKFTDLTTVNERLKGKEWISQEFKGQLNGWSEGYFIAANRDENGKCNHLIWATKNITEMKVQEKKANDELKAAIKKAQVANAAKTNFLFNMSHDIRTPMNAIVGFTELLDKNLDNVQQCKQYIQKMRSSSEILLSLINNVLEMARIESGKTVLDETVWKIEEFNDSLYSLFEQPMREKGIKYTQKVDVVHENVYCDKVKLREIYLNLISNAYKYTLPGGKVVVDLKEIDSDRDGYALFEVKISDTGIGMAEDYIPHIFEEFSREKSATDSKIEGTGLGMPIVKKLVDLMGGTIEVESELGKGTTFTIRVYHRIAEKREINNSNEKTNYDEYFIGKRILLAEDNDLNAEIAIAILEDAGFVIDRASDGAICVDMLLKAEEDKYDMILMDIQMPNINGYEATKLIRRLEDKKKAEIPIVAMTANAFEEDKKTAIEAGMNDHLAKPIDIKKMMQIVKKYV